MAQLPPSLRADRPRRHRLGSGLALVPGTAARAGDVAGAAAWPARWRLGHAAAAVAATLVLTPLLAGAAGPVGLPGQLAALAVALAVFGLPYGALGRVLGARLFRPHPGPGAAPPFLVAHLALAGLAAVLWWTAPAAVLSAVLIVAALHFGFGDVEERLTPPGPWHLLEALARGALPIVLPAAFWPGEVAALLARPAPALDAAVLAGRLEVIGPVALGALAALLAAALARHLEGAVRGSHRAARLTVCAEFGALAAAFALLPPVLGLATYLGLWRGPRRALDAAAALDPGRPGAGLAALLGLGTAPVASGAAALGLAAVAGPAPVRALLVALVVLAVPHMALVARLRGEPLAPGTVEPRRAGPARTRGRRIGPAAQAPVLLAARAPWRARAARSSGPSRSRSSAAR